jgi:hypothetical protein
VDGTFPGRIVAGSEASIVVSSGSNITSNVEETKVIGSPRLLSRTPIPGLEIPVCLDSYFNALMRKASLH